MSLVFLVLRIAVGLWLTSVATSVASTGVLKAEPVVFVDSQFQSLRSSIPMAQLSTKILPSTRTEAQTDRVLHSQTTATISSNVESEMERPVSHNSEAPFVQPVATTLSTVTPTIYPLPQQTQTTASVHLAPFVRSNKAPILFISLQANQIVDGVSFASYTSDKAGCNSVFTATIAASAGTSTDSIKELTVNEGTTTTATHATTRPNLRAPVKSVSSDALALRYTIQVPVSSGVTYEQVSTQLTTSVESGQFSTQLQELATEQNVPELIFASSSSIVTQDTSPMAPPRYTTDEDLSESAVAGIVLCTIAGALFFAFTMYRMSLRPSPNANKVQVPSNARGEGFYTSTAVVDSPLHQASEDL